MSIDKEDMDRLREIFVTRQECDTITDGLQRRLSDDNARLAVIESQLKAITGILAGVGGGVLTMLVKMFFGG